MEGDKKQENFIWKIRSLHHEMLFKWNQRGKFQNFGMVIVHTMTELSCSSFERKIKKCLLTISCPSHYKYIQNLLRVQKETETLLGSIYFSSHLVLHTENDLLPQTPR